MASVALLWFASAKCCPRLLWIPLIPALLILPQLIPLPDGLLGLLAPVSAGAWKVANAGAGRVWGTISIDPAATAAGMRRAAVWLAAVLAISQLARRTANRNALSMAMAASAALMGALAYAFPVSSKNRFLLGFIGMNGPTSEWWKSGLSLPVESDGGGFLGWATIGSERYRFDEVLIGDGFGPYLTSNQFAGGLCLTLPFLMAACVALAKRFGKPSIGYAAVAALMAAATWTLWHKAGSRAGTASILAAEFVFLAAISRNVWARRVTGLAAIAYGTCLLVLIAGLVGVLPGLDRWFPAPIQAKVASFLQDPRAVAANVARRMFFASPVLGTGLNSYTAIYPRFDPGDFTLYYAYNDYTQLLAETGIIGMAAAIAMAIPLFRRMWRVRGVPEGTLPMAAAAAAAIAGLASHMAFEWNLHQPANSFLACLTIGLFMGIVPLSDSKPKKRPEPDTWATKASRGTFVGMIGLSVALLARDAQSGAAIRELRGALVSARPDPKQSNRPDPAPLLDAALRHGERAAAWDPANAHLQLVQGQAHLHLSQLREGAEREVERSVAMRFFQKAQRLRALIIGLPEPILPAGR